MTDLISLPNIGKELDIKLKSVGIYSAEDLKIEGSQAAFFKLKNKYPNVCLVHLYCLQGAIDLVAYNHLSTEMKQELKTYVDSLDI